MSFHIAFSDFNSGEAKDELMKYCSSDYDSEADDCYVGLQSQVTTKQSKSTTTKDATAYPSKSSAPPSRRSSRSSTISSTASVSSASFQANLSSCLSLSSSGSRREKKKTKRSVRFSDALDQVHDILPLQQFTKKERKDCWYTKADIIKRNACLDLLSLKMEEKKSPKKDEDTYRGLEDLDPEHRAKSEKRRQAVVQAVLRAQSHHGSDEERVEFGVVAPIYLAVASMELSTDSKTDALEQGMTDMLVALPYSLETKKPRRSSLPEGQKLGTMLDPYPVPDRPRRFSAPASTLLSPAMATKKESGELPKAIADFDIDLTPPPPVLDVILTPDTTKSKRRHSHDSTSKTKSKSSKSKSIIESPIKSKNNNTLDTLPSPHARSPVKKKAKPSFSSSPKSKRSSKSSRSRSPSSRSRRSSSSNNGLPFFPTSPPSAKVSSPSYSKKQPRKRLVSSTLQSPRSGTHNKNTSSPMMGSPIPGIIPGGIHIHAPTPPRKDPPGMFRRIASIRLDDQYPPVAPRL